jgi:hypothetical protein
MDYEFERLLKPHLDRLRDQAVQAAVLQLREGTLTYERALQAIALCSAIEQLRYEVARDFKQRLKERATNQT